MRLMEGLECHIARFSGLERTQRIDAQWFERRHIQTERLLSSLQTEPVTGCAAVSDGNHFSISEEFAETGMPYYRGQDVAGRFFVEESDPVRIPEKAFNQPWMSRSHLAKGDVLLSIVGTIGELSLVSEESPATCSCKLAILRPDGIAAEYLATFLRSAYGRTQIERLTRGAVQMGLILEDMDQLKVVRPSGHLELEIARCVQRAKANSAESHAATQRAEASILEHLGLSKWNPPDPSTYIVPFTRTVKRGRLDAQFYRPAIEATIERLDEQFDTCSISDLGMVENGQTVAYDKEGRIPIIRSGDLSDIEDESKFLKASQTEPIFDLKSGDVLISSIGFGSIGKVQVFNKPGRYGTVSEVTVIRQRKLNPYFVGAFLRSRVGQMQIERYITGATGQLHLYKSDVQKIVVPILQETQQKQFEELAREAIRASNQSRMLLERAKRAVEIAVEDSESSALQYLNEEHLPAKERNPNG